MAQLLAGPSLTTASPSWDIVTVGVTIILVENNILPLLIRSGRSRISNRERACWLHVLQPVYWRKILVWSRTPFALRKELARREISIFRFEPIESATGSQLCKFDATSRIFLKFVQQNLLHYSYFLIIATITFSFF